MDPRIVEKKDGKAFAVLKVHPLDGHFIAHSYELRCFDEIRISNTGWLKVFELVPHAVSEPRFIGRWDERAEQLDVDITGVPESISQKFKRGSGGYNGHHSQRLATEGRQYKVAISIPEGKIFEAVMCFGVLRELELKGSLEVKSDLAIEAEVIRGEKTHYE